MNAEDTLHSLYKQREAIAALVHELDEVQVTFNAQFDSFRARREAALEQMTNRLVERLDAAAPGLRAAVEARLPEERSALDQRRAKVRETYLPQRREAADQILRDAQAELAQLRARNPELDRQEEDLKAAKAKLEAQLAALNDEIRRKSRGLGVVTHLMAITRADRERQRIVGRLESANELLFKVRKTWEEERTKVEASQAAAQERWQLESMAVARLQAELDQLDDDAFRKDLALHRAIRHVLDGWPSSASESEAGAQGPDAAGDPDVAAGLAEIADLNAQAAEYRDALAAVGGLSGLLGGIDNGLQALGKSIEGLREEQHMHSAYLRALDFSLPASAQRLGQQWPALAQRFADEKQVAAHPAEFAAAVEPLLEGPLSQASIEATFDDLGRMIEQAAARWG